jgi:hypothetical protein
MRLVAVWRFSLAFRNQEQIGGAQELHHTLPPSPMEAVVVVATATLMAGHLRHRRRGGVLQREAARTPPTVLSGLARHRGLVVLTTAPAER